MPAALRRLVPPLLAVAALVLLPAIPGSAGREGGPEESLIVTLTGAQAVPPNGSLATGSGEITIRGDRMSVALRWTRASGPVTGAHLHGPALAGDDCPVVFSLVPGKLPEGSASPLEAEFDVGHVERDQLLAGRFTADLHTATYPGGEIRGQVVRRADD